MVDLALVVNTVLQESNLTENELIVMMFAVWEIAMQARDFGSRDECSKLFLDTIEKVKSNQLRLKISEINEKS